MDPNYLEKFKAHTSVLKMSLMPYVDQSTGPPTSSTVPIASGENTALSESTQCDASRSDPAALQSVQQNLPAPTTALTMESGAEASTSVAPAMVCFFVSFMFRASYLTLFFAATMRYQDLQSLYSC